MAALYKSWQTFTALKCYSNDLLLDTVWSVLENGHEKEDVQWLRIDCKVFGQTGSLSEFSQGIFEKLKRNSIIRKMVT